MSDSLDRTRLFGEMAGALSAELELPYCPTKVSLTSAGTRYLTDCGVAMIGRTYSDLSGVENFIEGFDEAEGFDDYLIDPVSIGVGERLSKFAGQLCYMSLGEKRTKNDGAEGYFDNIKKSRHGSVLEHANYTFLFYGLSRSMTHELVRHRLASYSQVSQRYVGGNVLRFVRRPEFGADRHLAARFTVKIDADKAYYEHTCDILLGLQEQGYDLLDAEKKTEARKKVRQCARESLPNCTEAPIVVTANVRTWRHILDMRASAAAEIEIRRLALKTYLCLAMVDSLFWNDLTLQVMGDGTHLVDALYKKV
jgi:thymidylate synthase (FAD)